MDRSGQNARIVAIARRWIGTPYCHQASLEGVGADCLGLFRGVWRELFGQEPARIPVYTSDWDVGDGEERLRSAADGLLGAVENGAQRDGDAVLFRVRDAGPAKHLGILASDRSGQPTFIHSYSLHGVVESGLTSAWSRRVDGYFSFPAGSSSWRL